MALTYSCCGLLLVVGEGSHLALALLEEKLSGLDVWGLNPDGL
jgi:hypothetical protein